MKVEIELSGDRKNDFCQIGLINSNGRYLVEITAKWLWLDMKYTGHLCIHIPYIIFSSVFWTIWFCVGFMLCLELLCFCIFFAKQVLFTWWLMSTNHPHFIGSYCIRQSTWNPNEVTMASETEARPSIAASNTKGMVPSSGFVNNLNCCCIRHWLNVNIVNYILLYFNSFNEWFDMKSELQRWMV